MTAALVSHKPGADLQVLLPYLVRWVAVGVVDTLRTGTQTKADGRALVSALLDDPTLFAEPYVSYPRICFPLLMRLQLHQLLPLVLSVPLHSSPPPRHRTRLIMLVVPPNTTFHDVYFLALRITTTLLLVLVSTGKSWGNPGRHHPGSRGCWEGRDSQGAHQMTRCEGCSPWVSGVRILIVSWSRDGEF